ncbi:uncharacterized protein PGTG_06684 [Puccinia graminis f. sp. tritici CRL 75-36-700-3]|uniref:Uncharacterized protein n=1 Tax=Puccinia graminis f. sp. tritici (strain CRL 75-36-700-3 / race SCCL) TaxID=418459 RepID=E3K8B0_PUCGT|nr:uncharacterized protein PGTG_06684 [Puccinia graminis f. sp. tritici CRL 75-36-700-3]EFP80728.2 hypothetical protein PGTG_06684 [Puccinia graminis f. sp. tritici CRL 75-36-700-3]
MNGSKINNSRPGRTLFGCEHEQHKRRTLGAVVIIRHVQGVLQFTTNSLASDDSVPLELYKRGIAGVTPGQGLLLRQPTSTPDVRRAEASGTTDSMKESRSSFCYTPRMQYIGRQTTVQGHCHATALPPQRHLQSSDYVRVPYH